jgi:hypothetical protein
LAGELITRGKALVGGGRVSFLHAVANEKTSKPGALWAGGGVILDLAASACDVHASAGEPITRDDTIFGVPVSLLNPTVKEESPKQSGIVDRRRCDTRVRFLTCDAHVGW